MYINLLYVWEFRIFSILGRVCLFDSFVIIIIVFWIELTKSQQIGIAEILVWNQLILKFNRHLFQILIPGIWIDFFSILSNWIYIAFVLQAQLNLGIIRATIGKLKLTVQLPWHIRMAIGVNHTSTAGVGTFGWWRILCLSLGTRMEPLSSSTCVWFFCVSQSKEVIKYDWKERYSIANSILQGE